MSDFSVESMAEALTANKEKDGHKGKIYKEIADQHKSEQISLWEIAIANCTSFDK